MSRGALEAIRQALIELALCLGLLWWIYHLIKFGPIGIG